MDNSIGSLAGIKRLDRLGFSASTLCALHCALMPLLITTLPWIGLQFMVHPHFETGMIAASVMLGAVSLSLGYLRHHRKLWAVIIFLSGLSAIGLGHLEMLEKCGDFLIPTGAFAVAASHLINGRLCRSCRDCNPDEGREGGSTRL